MRASTLCRSTAAANARAGQARPSAPAAAPARPIGMAAPLGPRLVGPAGVAQRCRRLAPVAALGSEEPDDTFISSEEAYTAHLASADVVVADFMARWCRKCIYIKPKLATLMASKFPAVPLGFIDVNAVPSSVVSGAGVTKMPTIVVFVKGEAFGDPYIAGESASTAVLAVEAMVDKAVKAAKKK